MPTYRPTRPKLLSTVPCRWTLLSEPTKQRKGDATRTSDLSERRRQTTEQLMMLSTTPPDATRTPDLAEKRKQPTEPLKNGVLEEEERLKGKET